MKTLLGRRVQEAESVQRAKVTVEVEGERFDESFARHRSTVERVIAADNISRRYVRRYGRWL